MSYQEIQREFDLMDYWRVIVKRKGILFIFAGTIILLIGLYSFTTPPKYKSTATILIGGETSKTLNIDDELGLLSYRSQMRDMIFLNTQLTLLKSFSLAERVARNMELLSRPEFSNQGNSNKNLFGKIKSFILLKWLRSKKEENADGLFFDPYEDIAVRLRGGIDVEQIRETKVLSISYTSRHPLLTAEIVNNFAEEFINFSIEKRYETTKQATDFLSKEIVDLRQDLASKEQELQRYGQEKELFFLSDEENTAVKNLADLNAAYTQAQIDRATAESAYRELRNADVDSIPRTGANRVIQTLEEEYTRMKNEYVEKTKIYKPEYPDMIQLNSKIESMRQELENELIKARNQAELVYRSALQNEYQLRTLLQEQRQDVATLNSNAIFYNSLKIEVENKRNLLNSLVEKQNETLVSTRLSGLKSSNISIIDRAKIPRSPISPNRKLNLLLALLMGLSGGIGLCFIMEFLDNTIKGPEDVQKISGLPSLGTIPFLSPDGMKKKSSDYNFGYGRSCEGENQNSLDNLQEIKKIELVNHIHPQFFISENYRTIRTSIMLSHAGHPPESIVFTSCLPNEGKTVSVANMAIAFAQLEKKVLIIDADLRKPRLHKIFNINNIGGLSGYLTSKVSIKDAIQKTEIENIWILPSGPIPPNPAELLNSQKMKIMIQELKSGIDLILLDTPPVLAVVDALIICSMADCAALVIQPSKTKKKSFSKTIVQLQQSHAKLIGVIFNRSDVGENSYYYPYYNYMFTPIEDHQNPHDR